MGFPFGWSNWIGGSDPIVEAQERGYREAASIYEYELKRILEKELPKIIEEISGRIMIPKVGKLFNEFDKLELYNVPNIPPIGFTVCLFPKK